jgi:phage terminase small subunit
MGGILGAMPKLKNPKRESFCLQYMKDRNATASYIRAGYAVKGSEQNAHRLISIDEVAARIAELTEKLAAKVEMQAEDVLRRYIAIATADRNELTSVEIGACRHCHSVDHAYHWRTPREFRAALGNWAGLSEAKQAIVPMPDDDGGYGFTTRAAPHTACPECDGRGASYPRIHDTTRLSDAGRTIYAGMKETTAGIEVKTLDADHALDQIARHLGMFDKDNQRTHGVTDALSALLDGINSRGSKAPLTAATRSPAPAKEGGLDE